MTFPPPVSPCIGICTLDPTSELCQGCYRNIDEIIDWSIYNNQQKTAVLEAITVRRDNAGKGVK